MQDQADCCPRALPYPAPGSQTPFSFLLFSLFSLLVVCTEADFPFAPPPQKIAECVLYKTTSTHIPRQPDFRQNLFIFWSFAVSLYNTYSVRPFYTACHLHFITDKEGYPMNLQQLYYFRKLAEVQHYTEAAKFSLHHTAQLKRLHRVSGKGTFCNPLSKERPQRPADQMRGGILSVCKPGPGNPGARHCSYQGPVRLYKRHH